VYIPLRADDVKGSCLGRYTSPQNDLDLKIKSFQLCEAKRGYVWNFTIYVGQDTAVDSSLCNDPYGSIVVLK
jgi:hypothetical protein